MPVSHIPSPIGSVVSDGSSIASVMVSKATSAASVMTSAMETVSNAVSSAGTPLTTDAGKSLSFPFLFQPDLR